ncbi:MAG: TAXI family TRAP transporter solute-binding subunit [Pseudomonadota bacterium]
MKKIIRFGSFVLLLFTSLASAYAAAAYDMGIVTGGKTGTYIQIGKNIQGLLYGHDINLDVHPSTGSMENITSVLKRKGIQLGIVQSDVLSYIEDSSDDQDMKRYLKKIKLIFPLYNEEVHILARKPLKTLSDLQNKRVALGRDGSGTFLTSSTILNLAEIRLSREYLVGGEAALEALKANRIDAMFYVAGSPVKLFRDRVHSADELNLIEIDDKAVKELYSESRISRGTYAWQKQDLNTVSVKAMLITYDYQHANCKRVADIAELIYKNKPLLENYGHTKWKDVDLNASLPKKWQRYSCVRDRLKLGTPLHPTCHKITNPISRKICSSRQ